MKISDKYVLSTLETLVVKSEKSHRCISLVRDTASGTLYMRKDFYTKNGLKAYQALNNLTSCDQIHPNLPKVFKVIASEDGYTVIEEFIHGKSLAGIVHSPEATLGIIRKLCEAVKFLHNQDPPIIHRDIKPDNILVSTEGRLVLIDYDAAKNYAAHKEADTTRLGTKKYAPPESYGYAKTDARTDVYSIGATMHMLLMGAHYNHENPYAGPYKDVVSKAMELDPKNRYQSVEALEVALRFRVSRSIGVKDKICVLLPEYKGKGAAAVVGLSMWYALLTFVIVIFFEVVMEDIRAGYNAFMMIYIFVTVLFTPYVLACNFFGTRTRIFAGRGFFKSVGIIVTGIAVVWALGVLLSSIILPA